MINKNIGMMRGGGETRTLRFASGLEARGFDVTVLYNRPLRGHVRHPLPPSVAVHEIVSPYLRDLTYRLPKGRGLAIRAEEAVFQRHVLAQIDRLPPADIVFSFGLFPLAHAIKQRLGCPVIVANSGGMPLGDVTVAVHAVDAILVDGYDVQLFPERFGVTPVEVRKGVDTAHFRPRENAGADRAPLRLLFVGRLVPMKNHHRLLDLVRDLKAHGRPVTLTLAGEGSLRGRLQRQAHERGVAGEVTFPGYHAPSEVPAVYREHDVFVLASSFDNFPNAVLEAMASGLPVVAVRGGGVPSQVVDGVTGILVPDGDGDAFRAAIERLDSDRALARAMGRAGRERVVREFSWERCFDELAELLHTHLPSRRERVSRLVATY
jgi:glycosyltransferase involved in cell wall biosynthesis